MLQKEWVIGPFVRRLLEGQAIGDRRDVEQQVERQNGLQPVQDRGKDAPRLLPGQLDQRTSSAAADPGKNGCGIGVKRADMPGENVTAEKSFRSRKRESRAMNRYVRAMKQET